MSREIDVTNPDSWDEDDVRYLSARGKISDEDANEALDRLGADWRVGEADPPAPRPTVGSNDVRESLGQVRDDAGRYSSMSRAELDAELDKRNIERPTKLTNEQRIDILNRDDAGTIPEA